MSGMTAETAVSRAGWLDAHPGDEPAFTQMVRETSGGEWLFDPAGSAPDAIRPLFTAPAEQAVKPARKRARGPGPGTRAGTASPPAAVPGAVPGPASKTGTSGRDAMNADTYKVTAAHIADGQPGSAADDAVALAVAEAHPYAFAEAGADAITLYLPGDLVWEAVTPGPVAEFIRRFDGAEPVTPFEFTLDWRVTEAAS